MRMTFDTLLSILGNNPDCVTVHFALAGAQLCRDTMLNVNSKEYYKHGSLMTEITVISDFA